MCCGERLGGPISLLVLNPAVYSAKGHSVVGDEVQVEVGNRFAWFGTCQGFDIFHVLG